MAQRSFITYAGIKSDSFLGLSLSIRVYSVQQPNNIMRALKWSLVSSSAWLDLLVLAFVVNEWIHSCFTHSSSFLALTDPTPEMYVVLNASSVPYAPSLRDRGSSSALKSLLSFSFCSCVGNERIIRIRSCRSSRVNSIFRFCALDSKDEMKQAMLYIIVIANG